MEDSKKKFLYLVQSRISHLDHYQELKTNNADVIYATFEKKIDKPNHIYVPDTIWAEGRNSLVSIAMSRPKYQYYILLDDDAIFTTGSFQKFEQDVLKVGADFAMPNYLSDDFGFITNYNRINCFDYSKFVFFDSCFICLSAELFFDERLIPYHTSYHEKIPIFSNSFYSSRLFWMNLFEYHSDKRLLMLNNIKIYNSQHAFRYNTQYHYSDIYKKIKQDYPEYKFRIEKAMPSVCIDRLLDAIIKIKRPYRLLRLQLRLVSWLFIWLLIVPLALLRDIKLYFRLKKETHDL